MGEFETLCQGTGTDKGKYAAAYEEIFKGIRDDIKKILEFGVLYGSSLFLWREYFPNAEIIGVDSMPYGGRLPDRTQVFEGEQQDAIVLEALKQKGPFDVIVDDAGHVARDYITSFFALKNSTEHYIIEDVTPHDVDYFPVSEGFIRFHSSSTPEFLVYKRKRGPNAHTDGDAGSK